MMLEEEALSYIMHPPSALRGFEGIRGRKIPPAWCRMLRALRPARRGGSRSVVGIGAPNGSARRAADRQPARIVSALLPNL